jgi:hypothetical protein
LVNAKSVDGLTFTGNTVRSAELPPYKPLFELDACTNIEISGNDGLEI